MARLVIESGPEAGMVLPVGNDRLVIGRGVSCGVQILDRRVSREHAVISFHRGGYILEDLESRNGTFLNHQPLVGRLRLRSGDRVSVGGTVLAFELDPEDLSREGRELNRVRLSADSIHELPRAEKPLDTDTVPIIGLEPIPAEFLKDPQHRLRVIYQVSDSLRGELELDDLLWKIMDAIWAVASPHRGIIFVGGEKDQRNLAPALVRTRKRSEDEIVISEGIVDRCFTGRVAVLMADAPTDEHFAENHSISIGKIRSAICAPLIASGKSLGVIYLDIQDVEDEPTRSFTQDDLDLVSGIALQAAMAVHNARLHDAGLRHQRLEKELEIARQIQEGLLPKSYPQVQRVQFSAMCLPARQVGGDYYDFLDMPDHRIAMVVGDASGKGVPAAILVSMVRAALRAQVRMRPPRQVSEIVTALNHSVCVDALPDDLVTLFMMVYDPANGTMNYTNAGHVPGLLARHGETGLLRLNEGGLLLGVSEDASYVESRLQLSAGDLLVLYTDGVTDTYDLSGHMFTEQRLTEVILRHRQETAEHVRDAIYRSLVEFRESNEQFDDLTLLVMKIE